MAWHVTVVRLCLICSGVQVVAVCMVDDLIEFGGVGAHKYIPQSLDIFLGNLQSDHPVLRQSSAYGTG